MARVRSVSHWVMTHQGMTDTAAKSGGWGDLGNMKVHKSGLEKAKDAAEALPRQPAK